MEHVVKAVALPLPRVRFPGWRWKVLFLAAVVGCTSESEERAGSPDAGDADSAPYTTYPCQIEQTALITYVKENKSCQADSDCAYVYSRSDIREHCGGGFYLSTSYDHATFSALEAPVAACLGPPYMICAVDPPPPACWHGLCVIGVDLGVRDECIGMYGDTPCTLWACSVCAPGLFEPARKIFDCARAAGCLGTVACDLTNPKFPCKNEVDQAGGIDSAAAQQYRQTNDCLGKWQCSAVCSE